MRAFNVKSFYIYKFLHECMPIYAFYTILFINKGMSIADIAVLMALWSGFTIVAEVPSGVLEDRWNRRNMLVIAAVLQGFCFLIWFFAQTLPMFALGFAFFAIAEAFTSGTEEGLIYDNLKVDGCEERFAEVYGKARFYANVGMVIGIAAAGFMASYVSIEAIALLSAALCFINIIFISQIREKNYYSERLEEKSMKFLETLKEAGVFIKESQTALIVLLFLVLFVAVGGYLDEFDALITNDFKLSNIWVSVILTVRFVFVALGDVLAPMVQTRISSIRQIVLLNGLAFVFLLAFAMIWNQYALLTFGIAFMVMAITEILLVDILQNEIQEEGRATVMSFYGIGQNIVMICFSLIYALLAGVFSLQQVYIIISIYGVAGGLSFCLHQGGFPDIMK